MTTALQPVKLALGADFLVAFSKLPQKQQRKVREFLDKFAANPDGSSTNYEKIRSARDPNLRSVRIDQAYRGIVLKPQQGNVYVMLWVDKHDDAYHWAERRTCAVHPETGTMQVMLTKEAAMESMAETVRVAPASNSAGKAVSGIYDALQDEDLVSLGVPESLLAIVRDVKTEDSVDSLEKVLPREAFEGVYLLAAGYSVAEAREQLGIAKLSSVDTEDFAAAVDRQGSQRQFVVITDAAEMEMILSAPLEQWRVFLHPSQRKLVEMRANGPVRVLGSAGTGKTVVAMHRAVWLVRHACKPGEKVLFTTFTKNLAADISENLKKICSREEWDRIEVLNLDAWVHRFLEKQRFNLRLTYRSSGADELWQKAVSVAGELPFSSEFMRGEWDNVIQAQGIDTWENYMTASRAGRSRRLNRSERKQLWTVFAEYRALLNEKGLSEPADAFRAASKLIAERKVEFLYRGIVVDEAQDFGNEAFRLLRALVRPTENDMFIVGDAHQRIYGQQVVLSRCGIDIRGRGKKLRINYRTTEELKNWATGLLKGLTFDDLDANADDSDGVRSLVHGEPPILKTCTSEGEASQAICRHVQELLSGGIQPETICLVAATRRELDEYSRALKSVLRSLHHIEPGKADDSQTPGLRLATIHRVKGLEFDHVVMAGRLVGLDEAAADPESVAHERALIYVAATRPRRSLFVCRVR